MLLWALAGLVLFGYLLVWPHAWTNLADPESSQIQRSEVIFNLPPGESAVQVFTSRRSGLNSLTIWAAGAADQTRLDVSIQPADRPAVPFSQTTRTVSAEASAFTVNFPPRFDGANQAYRLVVTCNAPDCTGAQVFGSTDPDSAPTGWAALPNGASLPADLAFTTTYAYTALSLLEDAWTLLRLSPAIILALFIVIVPGWVTLALAVALRKPKNRLSHQIIHDPALTTALAIGLSLSLIALVLLWTTTLHITWRGWMIAVALSGLAVLFAFLVRRKTQATLSSKGRNFHKLEMGVFLLFLAVLLVRFAMVRDLAGPPWVDAFHHALLSRLILQQGALPDTLEPYLSIAPTAYHLGYHSSLALYTWLSRLDVASAMLIFGQVLNALVVFPVFALTRSMTGSRRAGLAAALAAGLLSPMPAYYTSWSRYTHLAGMLALPAFVILARQAYMPVSQARSWKDWAGSFILAAIALGGLALLHYRVAAFAGLLTLFDCLWHAWATRNGTRPRFVAGILTIIRLGAVGVSAFLVASPWLVRALIQTILPTASFTAGEPAKWFDGFSFSSLSAGQGLIVIYAAGIGLAFALVQRPRWAGTMSSWTAALFLLANLGALNLPGSSLINQPAVTISLFLPLSMLAGWGFDRAARFLELGARRMSWPAARLAVIWSLLAVILGIQGAIRQVPLLNTGTFLLRQADIAGLAWAEVNLPPAARVAVNPFNWGYGVYAPADGGGWLAGVSGIVSVPAPVLSGLEANQRLRDEIQLSKAVVSLGNDPEGLAVALQEAQVGYVFIGAKGGPIRARYLLSSSRFKLLFDSNGVRIFAVNP